MMKREEWYVCNGVMYLTWFFWHGAGEYQGESGMFVTGLCI